MTPKILEAYQNAHVEVYPGPFGELVIRIYVNQYHYIEDKLENPSDIERYCKFARLYIELSKSRLGLK